MKNYIVYLDESWVQTDPLYRYHCFFGGFISSKESFDELARKIEKVKKKHNYKKEIKWTNLSKLDINFYNELLREIGAFIDECKDIKYSQSFQDRSIKYTGEPCSYLDMQFKILYQFIKHGFGTSLIEEQCLVHINCDEHSNRKNKITLESFINTLSTSNTRYIINFIDSKKSLALQVCDLLMGAAGYYGNKVYNDRKNGAKRISGNQTIKKDFCKKVYDLFKEIDQKYRGSKAFNWFETTGNRYSASMFYPKISIWKFKPREHEIDKSWENDAFKSNEVRCRINDKGC